MRLIFLALLVFILGCDTEKPSKDPLEFALNSKAASIKRVVDSVDKYEVQIKLSEISRAGDSIMFIDYDYGVNDANYFYPASSVKLPIALLALEKVFNMPRVTSETLYIIEGDSMTHTIRDDIKQIFAISDNEAYNRLYNFLGRDYINQKLRTKNLGPVRISHRLSVPNAHYNTTKPISFWESDTIFFIQDAIVDQDVQNLNLNRQTKGRGYFEGSTLIEKPMDFSQKNYLPITTLHNIMKALIFPGKFPAFKTFQMEPEDRTFLLNTMQSVPRNLNYNEKEYYDAYVKFFMYGDNKERIPDYIKIYNKVGYAYGYLTDCAYIRDAKTNTEFILTATIHVNENGIFNDDDYQYDDLGIPFLATLGREVHSYISEKKTVK